MASFTPVPQNGMAATQVTGMYQDNALCQVICQLQNLAEKLTNQDFKDELNLARLASELQAEKQKNMALVDKLKLSQAKLMAELQAEKLKNVTLKEEMKLSRAKLMAELQLERRKITFLREDLKSTQTKFTTELYTEKQANLTLKEELQAEKRSNTALIDELKLSQATLMAELQAKILAERQAQRDDEDEDEFEFNDLFEIELWLEKQARKDRMDAKTLRHNRYVIELNVQREMNKELKEELKFSQDKIMVAEQKNKALKKDLKLLVQKMMDDKDALQQKTAEEIRCVKEKAAKQEVALQRELEALKAQLNAQLSPNTELSVEPEADEEKEQKSEENPEPGTSEPKETTTKRSAWKRACRFLGLKRRQRCHKSAAPASTSD